MDLVRSCTMFPHVDHRRLVSIAVGFGGSARAYGNSHMKRIEANLCFPQVYIQ